MWAFECPTHADMNGLCLHPGNVASQPSTFDTLEVTQAVERRLNGLPPQDLNLTLFMLDPPLPNAERAPWLLVTFA